MGVGETLGNAVLEFILKGDIEGYLSLHTAAPPGNEVTGTGYAREALAPGDWGDADDNTITSVNQVTFSPAGASWGTVTHIGIYDAPTGGNLLWWGPLGTPRAVGSGDTVTFPAGNLTGMVA